VGGRGHQEIYLVNRCSGCEKGKIINLTSETAFTGSGYMLHYLTSKGDIVSFTRALARELGQHGICVNAVAPGFTDTKASRTLINDITKYDVSLTPLGSLEVPEDLVGAIIFLASNESDFIEIEGKCDTLTRGVLIL
jgi:3-oxoacyl-[acyl-carrier protein] reductase